MNMIQEDYNDRKSIVGIKGRHIGEAVLDYVPDPPGGWAARTTQSEKLKSEYVKNLLPSEVIKRLSILQSLSNDAGHYNIGSRQFLPSDKPLVANAAFVVCRFLADRMLTEDYPADIDRAHTWLGIFLSEGSLHAWLVAAKCDQYEGALLTDGGYQDLTDLCALLDLSDDGIKGLLSEIITKPADMNRFIKKVREDFSLWLQKYDCLIYKKDLDRLGFMSIDDMYELNDKSDDFIQGKFQFIAEKKKLHLVKLIKGIRSIV